MREKTSPYMTVRPTNVSLFVRKIAYKVTHKCLFRSPKIKALPLLWLPETVIKQATM